MVEVQVESRDETGKNACGRLRRRGLIPGNVYGLDRPPFKVAVNPRRIDELLQMGSGVNTIFALSLVGESRTREAMIKELQRDPVTDLPIHVDFIRVDPTKKVRVEIPVRLIGTADGVKNEGGIVDFVLREVEVECLPTDIPEHLDVDISALRINQHVSVRDLARPEAVLVLDDAERIVAVVVAPRLEEEPVPAEAEEAAATAEPEVEKKGKEAAAAEGESDKES
jgi:large subunit ribosomal protein L25